MDFWADRWEVVLMFCTNVPVYSVWSLAFVQLWLEYKNKQNAKVMNTLIMWISLDRLFNTNVQDVQNVEYLWGNFFILQYFLPQNLLK